MLRYIAVGTVSTVARKEKLRDAGSSTKILVSSNIKMSIFCGESTDTNRTFVASWRDEVHLYFHELLKLEKGTPRLSIKSARRSSLSYQNQKLQEMG